ncbi:MAG: S1C family serine protease [Acidimicrobiia bacterium]
MSDQPATGATVPEPVAETPPTPSTPSTPPVTPPATPTATLPEVPPVDPTGPPPWPTAPIPGGPVGPPPPPPPGASPARPRPWKQFVAGALVGALVGGATAGGVYLATRDDSTTHTVIVRESGGTARNTSTIAEAHDIQGILAKVEPAVVAIRTGGAIEGVDSSSGGAGTGFVISSDGVIVTNNHVVEGSGGQIEVAFTDGTSLKAKVLGRSTDNDLAVLKVDATGLPVAKLGSSDKLQVGDEVIAIGNALALEGGLSVTRGIISAKDRTVPEESGSTLYSVLQTDAAINPGNSGGPLVNSDGEVVGINTAIADPTQAQNVGFAISIDMAKSVIDDLRQGREVKTAFLGVVTQQVTAAVAKELNLSTQTGVVIRQVSPGTAAESAGLKKNDVIIAVDGKQIATPDDLGGEVRKLTPGQKVDVLIERGGSEKTVSVTLGTRPTTNG